MKYNLRLTKIAGKHKTGRTVTTGWGNELPTMGRTFVMVCPSQRPDTEDPIRILITSKVTGVVHGFPTGNHGYSFETQNSSYLLEILTYEQA